MLNLYQSRVEKSVIGEVFSGFHIGDCKVYAAEGWGDVVKELHAHTADWDGSINLEYYRDSRSEGVIEVSTRRDSGNFTLLFCEIKHDLYTDTENLEWFFGEVRKFLFRFIKWFKKYRDKREDDVFEMDFATWRKTKFCKDWSKRMQQAL